MTLLAKKPNNETQAFEPLEKLLSLNTRLGSSFEAITKLASEICGVSIAVISLIDENQQWVKYSVGLAAAKAGTDRDIIFFSHALLKSDLVEVPDTYLNQRFKNNPLVTQQTNMRFYAGAPILTSTGKKIGTLSVIDQHRKQLSAAQKTMLTRLASLASQAVANRQKITPQMESNAHKLALTITASTAKKEQKSKAEAIAA